MEKINKTFKWMIGAALVVIAATSFSAVSKKDVKSGDFTPLVQQASSSAGEKVYRNHCISCHQEDGSGVPSMYPPLKDDKRVLGDKQLLIEVLMKGMEGPVLNKDQYMGAMASYKFLSDQKIADVLTYIRTSFGNEGSPVTPEEVAEVRKTID